MTAIALLFAFMLVAQCRAGLVELNCSDNATCIDNMAREFVRSVRQQKTVRLFDVITIEPLNTRQARSNQGLLSRFFQSHAFSFDWNDFTFRLTKPQGRSDVMNMEVFESRSAKDVSEKLPKKSSSKVEEEEDKKSKQGLKKSQRRQKRKVMQAVVPLLFGMKSAGAAIFGLAVVAALTIKAFLASKLALIVTIGMGMKKLYEAYSTGIGLQNHPYLYSQYPIDFPSASSHAYSVSGVSPHFASPEMFNPSALATHSYPNELLQQNDATAQQSQQASSLQLVNSTVASERWDGKSKLQRFLEPLVDGIRSVIDPIANVFYDAMPATFRGLTSDVSTTKKYESESTEEKAKKPKEILVPQPRYIAQRKTTNRKVIRPRPKKFTELKLDLNRLKKNKDFHDYIKTKKYKYNFPQTFYYPRIKYFINPNTFTRKPANISNPIYPKSETNSSNTSTVDNIQLLSISNDWRPIIVPNLNETESQNNNNKYIQSNISNRKLLRSKRSIFSLDTAKVNYNNKDHENNAFGEYIKNNEVARGLFWLFDLFTTDPITSMFNQANKYTKTVIKNSLKAKEPPKYYSWLKSLVRYSLEIIEGLVDVHKAIGEYGYDPKRKIKNKKKKKKPKKAIANQTIKDTDKDKEIENKIAGKKSF